MEGREALFGDDVLAAERREVGGELGALGQERERRRRERGLLGSGGSGGPRGVEAVVEVRAGDLGVDAWSVVV